MTTRSCESRFRCLVGLDQTNLEDGAIAELRTLSDHARFFDDDPRSEEETITRAQGADALLVSWRTPVTWRVIEACPDLRYIGMCCTLIDEASANVDIAHARARGIPVLGIRDYGDEGLTEFVLAELIRLFHGFGPHAWAEHQEELTGKTLGILGFGVTGQMLKDRALAFGMNVLYHSRTRRPELEGLRVRHASLFEVLEASDVISTHLPKHTVILDREAFAVMQGPKVLVNTSLEPTFDLAAFREWMTCEGHFCIADRAGLGAHYDALSSLDRMICTPKVTGFTRQARQRLSRKVVENVRRVLLPRPGA